MMMGMTRQMMMVVMMMMMMRMKAAGRVKVKTSKMIIGDEKQLEKIANTGPNTEIATSLWLPSDQNHAARAPVSRDAGLALPRFCSFSK
jgi:hypothetical protein